MTRDQRLHVVIGPVAIWGALMVLLAATTGYAYWPGAPAKLGISLSIGVMKALLVALLFMQLRRATGLVRLAAIAGVIWASFLYLFSFADFLTR